MTTEELIEEFVREAKLEGLGTEIGTVREMNEHGARSRACAAEIIARAALPAFLPLLESPDPWIVYSAAVQLLNTDETKGRALEALDGLADATLGNASSAADTARNMARYGHPLGEKFA